MLTPDQFPIISRWPPRNHDAIQLYTTDTPNGYKVSIALEEMGLPYDIQRVSFGKKDQFTPAFLSISPNNKIPAILDPHGPEGRPLALFESGAILLYLAEKTGLLLPSDPQGRWQTIQWLMFQMGGVGPMFGQVGFFRRFAGKDITDPRPRQRYDDEARRLLSVMERALQGRDWIADSYSIADIAICPWIKNLIDGYKAGDAVGWADFPNLQAWLARFLARPAVQRGYLNPPED